MWYMWAILVFSLPEWWIGRAIWGAKIYMIYILFWSLYFYAKKFLFQMKYEADLQKLSKCAGILWCILWGINCWIYVFYQQTPIFIKLASIFLFLYFKSPFFRYNIKKSILRGREIRWLCNRCVSLKYLFH